MAKSLLKSLEDACGCKDRSKVRECLLGLGYCSWEVDAKSEIEATLSRLGLPVPRSSSLEARLRRDGHLQRGGDENKDVHLLLLTKVEALRCKIVADTTFRDVQEDLMELVEPARSLDLYSQAEAVRTLVAIWRKCCKRCLKVDHPQQPGHGQLVVWLACMLCQIGEESALQSSKFEQLLGSDNMTYFCIQLMPKVVELMLEGRLLRDNTHRMTFLKWHNKFMPMLQDMAEPVAGWCDPVASSYIELLSKLWEALPESDAQMVKKACPWLK